MGIAPNVAFDHWPKQGPWLGKRARVCFHYEARYVMGTIVREDYEEPWVMVISLDDGRVVLGTECMYAPEK